MAPLRLKTPSLAVPSTLTRWAAPRCPSRLDQPAPIRRHLHSAPATWKKAKATNPRPNAASSAKATTELPPAFRTRTGFRPSAAAQEQQQPPPPNGDKREPLPELVRKYRLPFVGALVAGGLFAAYASYLATVFIQTSSSSACCATTTAGNDGLAGDGGGDDGDYDETLRRTEPAQPTGLPPTISRATAAEFDSGLDWPEWLMGVTKLRQTLASECRGDVLEVAVGTGRNFKWYDWDDIADVDPGLRVVRRLEKRRAQRLPAHEAVEMRSYTGVDVSADVLHMARRRIRSLVPGMKAALPRGRSAAEEAAGAAQFRAAGFEEFLNLQGDRLRLVRADVHNGLPLAPELPAAAYEDATAAAADPSCSGRYDTIVQTFGLCSVESPKRLLANMAGVLKPGTGRLLLLEHGRGTWGFVNKALDRLAPSHFQRFGCWWNRDIERIVRDAAREVPGLQVVSVRRPGLLQAGTTLLIELRLNPPAEQAGTGSTSASPAQASNKDTRSDTRSDTCK